MTRLPLLLLFGFLLWSGFLPAPALAQSVLYVDQSASGADDGTSWADAFTDLRDALAVADGGDEVRVAEGTYTPSNSGDHSASFEIGKGVRVLGGYPSGGGPRNPLLNETVLSGDLDGDDGPDFSGYAENSYHVVRIDLECTNAMPDPARLDGFVVTGGNANGSAITDQSGGGLLYAFTSTALVTCSSPPSIRNTVFVANRADRQGGAAALLGSDDFYPGIVALSNVVFSGNESQVGGAFAARGVLATRLRVARSIFDDNEASGDGGALYLRSSFEAEEERSVFTNAAFYGNRARSGGAVFLDGGLALAGADFQNTVFSGNEATFSGGAFALVAGKGSAFAAFSNATFAGNLAPDGGGGVVSSISTPFGFSDIVFDNTILWANSSPAVLPANSIVARHSLLQGVAPNVFTDAGGNFVADPLFADADGPDNITGTPDDDLTLLPASPAVDEGDRTVLPDDTADLDNDGDTSETLPLDLAGGPRIEGLGLDIGAYEAPSTGLEVRAGLQIDPVTVGAGGGALTYRVRLANQSAQAQSFDAWVDVLLPNGTAFGPVEGPRRVTLPAGRVTGPVTLQSSVPGNAPPGDYTALVRVGTFPDAVVAQGAFSFEKAGSARGTLAAADWPSGSGLDALAEATGTATPGAPAASSAALPSEVVLAPSYPNPFARTTTVGFALPEAAEVRLAVYDVLGRAVAVLAAGEGAAGRHEVRFDASALAGGVYLVRLEAGGQVRTQRITVLR